MGDEAIVAIVVPTKPFSVRVGRYLRSVRRRSHGGRVILVNDTVLYRSRNVKKSGNYRQQPRQGPNSRKGIRLNRSIFKRRLRGQHGLQRGRLASHRRRIAAAAVAVDGET